MDVYSKNINRIISLKIYIFLKFINMNINKLNHKIIFILLSPFFIYFGMKDIFFPFNILLAFIGILIIYIGNNKYEKTKNTIYLSEILIIGPLLFLLGITKNRYEYLKNMLTVIGFMIMIYHTRNIFIDTFLLRR